MSNSSSLSIVTCLWQNKNRQIKKASLFRTQIMFFKSKLFILDSGQFDPVIVLWYRHFAMFRNCIVGSSFKLPGSIREKLRFVMT